MSPIRRQPVMIWGVEEFPQETKLDAWLRLLDTYASN